MVWLDRRFAVKHFPIRACLFADRGRGTVFPQAVCSHRSIFGGG